MARTASERIEIRLRPEEHRDVERACALLDVNTSEFVREAVAARAEQVLAEQTTTPVPPEFFDRLLDALDQPPSASHALTRVGGRLAEITRR